MYGAWWVIRVEVKGVGPEYRGRGGRWSSFFIWLGTSGVVVMGSAQWHRSPHKEDNSHVHLLCKECIVHWKLWLVCTLNLNPRGKNLFQISLAQVGLIWLLFLPLLPFSPFPCLLWVHAEQPLLVKIISFVTSKQFQFQVKTIANLKQASSSSVNRFQNLNQDSCLLVPTWPPQSSEADPSQKCSWPSSH